MKKTQTDRRREILGILLALAFLAVLGLRLQGLRAQVENARIERDQYQEEVDRLQRENAALEADIEEGVTQEKMEEIARDQLGMVLPDEYVFYNADG